MGYSEDRDSVLQSAFEREELHGFYGNAKKGSESVSRYVEKPLEPYDIPWMATFMSRATEKLLFVRGKYNLLDVIDARSLKYVQTLDTKGFGIFSSITDPETNTAYLGSYEGHFFTVDLTSMRTLDSGYLKLRNGIYDMCILPD